MFESEYRYKPPFYLRRWVHVTFLLFFALGLAGVITVYIKLKPYQEIAQTFDFDDLNKLEKASIIYDREGEELGRIFVLNRDPVSIEKIPHHLIDAVVAAEDSRFFNHDGVDRWGMIRAAIRNVRAGTLKQGASTITQQLARNGFELKERSYERKLVEAFLAMRIERHFSKSDIMGMYLNRIYFGSGFYGVNAAAKGYFGKEVSEITIGEAATLAGLIKSPNKYSPLNNPELSKRERNYVFRRMAAENMLKEKEVKEFSARDLEVADPSRDAKRAFQYAYQQVRQRVIESLGAKEAQTGGFHIFTTIDAQLQLDAHQTLVKHLDRIEQHPQFRGQTMAEYLEVLAAWKKSIRETEDEEQTEGAEQQPPVPEYLQGAILVLDNRTGGIRAMVGGREFLHSMFDRTLQARRKPGTVFTPFVYATGFQAGREPVEKVQDSPIDNRNVQIGGMGGILGEWGAEGEPEYQNYLPARMALVKGKNAATVRYGIDVGRENIVNFAKKAGITFEGDLQNYNSTMLGQSEASIAEIALAYTIFPNLGRRVDQPFIVQSIRDDLGKTIFRSRPRGMGVEVMNSLAAYQMHNALRDVLRVGTAKSSWPELKDLPVAGKTGTTYNHKDLWFVGYSDQITCAVWAGFDRASQIYEGAFSNTTVLPLWTEFMRKAGKRMEFAEIKPPATAKPVEICCISGHSATEHCYHLASVEGSPQKVRDTYQEYFNAPRLNRTCAVHQPGGIVNLEVLRPISGFTIIESLNDGRRQKAIPIMLHEPTVIGVDPYHSIPLYKRLKKVEKMEETPEPALAEPQGPPVEVSPDLDLNDPDIDGEAAPLDEGPDADLNRAEAPQAVAAGTVERPDFQVDILE